MQLMSDGHLKVTADGTVDVGPGSITLHSSDNWYKIESNQAIWLDDPGRMPSLTLLRPNVNCHFSLAPRATYLVYSKEQIGIDAEHFGLISGTSDLARVGVGIQLSWFVAPGFGFDKPSSLVLEVQNTNDCVVHIPFCLRLAHLLIGRFDATTDRPYNLEINNYNSNRDITPASKIALRLSSRGNHI